MPTAVLTGCNSGLGHAWARILIDEGYDVYALDIIEGDNLKALEGKRCKIARVDVAAPKSIAAFKESFGDRQLDLLLNIAGIMPPREDDTLTGLNIHTLENAFAINTFGPVLLTQALLPNIVKAPGPRHIAVMSSRVGSIGDNSTGGSLSYRASKAALNSFFKSIALQLREQDIVVSMLHPGYTNTNLGPNIGQSQDAVEPEEAVSKLWTLLQSKGIQETGKFWHREGMELPW